MHDNHRTLYADQMTLLHVCNPFSHDSLDVRTYLLGRCHVIYFIYSIVLFRSTSFVCFKQHVICCENRKKIVEYATHSPYLFSRQSNRQRQRTKKKNRKFKCNLEFCFTLVMFQATNEKMEGLMVLCRYLPYFPVRRHMR